MKLKCIIIDDEQTARNGLAADVSEIPYISMTAQASNSFEALECINLHTPDLLFLDIEMPGLNGLDFLKLIRLKPMVIITTAYPQYALTGYELGVIDYLVKPISLQRLKTACDKAHQLHTLQQQAEVLKLPSDYCYFKCNGRLEKVAFENILFIEAANNYVFIHTLEKRFLVYSSLKSIAEHLPKDTFIQVHKSFIVNKNHIERITPTELLINHTKIPLSRNFRHSFQEVVIKPKAYKP